MNRRNLLKYGTLCLLVLNSRELLSKSNEIVYLINHKNPIKNAELLYSTINEINKVTNDTPVTIKILSDVLLTKRQRTNSTPFKNCAAKEIYAFPIIKKNNVTLLGHNVKISISNDIAFSKMEKKLCKSTDKLSYIFCIKGDDFSAHNLLLDGNLHNRKISRGSGKRGFGGEEFGLCLLGNNNSIRNCTIRNFSTDCIIVGGNTSLLNIVAEGSLRNQISVVNKANNHIKLMVRNIILRGHKGAQAIRPGSGIHVESNRGMVTVDVRDSMIGEMFGSGVRLSVGSKDCYFYNVTILDDIDIVDRKECNHGGHQFVNCKISGRMRKRFKRCQ